MFGGGLKISKNVIEKAKVAAGIIGCTLEEFVEKVVTTESDKVIATTSKRTASAKEVEEIANQLKGLGYLE